MLACQKMHVGSSGSAGRDAAVLAGALGAHGGGQKDLSTADGPAREGRRRPSGVNQWVGCLCSKAKKFLKFELVKPKQNTEKLWS